MTNAVIGIAYSVLLVLFSDIAAVVKVVRYYEYRC